MSAHIGKSRAPSAAEADVSDGERSAIPDWHRQEPFFGARVEGF
jgi:hypothetical protein